MIYQIGICDDNDADVRYLMTLTETWAKESGLSIRLDSFSSAESFLFHYAERKEYDILLLDIEMGGKNGIELAGQIRKENDSVQLVFITGFPDFVMEGYEVSALHYLMKPVDAGKLFTVLDRAVKNLEKAEETLLFQTDGESVRIPAGEIFAVEAFAHSVSIITARGNYKVNMSISAAEKTLHEGFIRCHRSYLVNLKHVRRITRTAVVLDNGTEIPLSRNSYQSVNQAFIEYYRSVEA